MKRPPEHADYAELVQIGIPILAEAIAVILFIAAGFVWLIILATPVPA